MTLALACGKPHIRKFRDELAKEDMDIWETWFAYSPQGQAAVLQMQANIASAQLAIKGCDLPPDVFMPWKQQRDEPSIDQQWSVVAGLIPKAPKALTQEPVDGTCQQSNPEQQPVHGGGPTSDRVQPCDLRLD